MMFGRACLVVVDRSGFESAKEQQKLAVQSTGNRNWVDQIFARQALTAEIAFNIAYSVSFMKESMDVHGTWLHEDSIKAKFRTERRQASLTLRIDERRDLNSDEYSSFFFDCSIWHRSRFRKCHDFYICNLCFLPWISRHAGLFAVSCHFSSLRMVSPSCSQ